MTSPKHNARALFMSYVKFYDADHVDVSGIFSKACFDEWRADKHLKQPSMYPKRFKDSLLCVLSGKNRCKPFPSIVEAEIVRIIRPGGRVWPCFEGMDNVCVGKQGTQILGFHERQQLANKTEKTSTAPIPRYLEVQNLTTSKRSRQDMGDELEIEAFPEKRPTFSQGLEDEFCSIFDNQFQHYHSMNTMIMPLSEPLFYHHPTGTSFGNESSYLYDTLPNYY